MSSEGLVHRRNVPRSVEKEEERDKDDDKKRLSDDDIEDGDSKETRLTLMEEVLLLGLKEKDVSYDFEYFISISVFSFTIMQIYAGTFFY